MPASLVDHFAPVVGAAGLRTGGDMAPYLLDWRGRRQGAAGAVVLPATTAEVAETVRTAARLGVPVFPQGGNTSLCYGTVPESEKAGIVLGLSRLNRIREVDRAANLLVAEAGVVLSAAHQAAEDIGRVFPLRLGSEGSAQIGGLISTNAGGTAALRYGVMRELVYGLEVVLPDGSVLSGLNALVKDNTGYDLRHLFIGAEGTLGIVTAAALKLRPAMRAAAHAFLSVASPQAAVDLLTRLADRFDTAIMACELLNAAEIDLVLTHVPRARQPLAERPAWAVIVELGAPDPNTDLHGLLEAFLAEALDRGGLLDGVVARSEAQANAFWYLRHNVSEANKMGGVGLTHDVSVRVSRVPDFIDQASALLAERFPPSFPVVVSHLGDGNVHFIAYFDHEGWAGLANPAATTEELQAAIHDIATGLGGSFSAEHGIGRKLVGELGRLTDPVEYRLMRTIKDALDPAGRMNPGVVLPMAS